jgi:hypothetical protein
VHINIKLNILLSVLGIVKQQLCAEFVTCRSWVRSHLFVPA